LISVSCLVPGRDWAIKPNRLVIKLWRRNFNIDTENHTFWLFGTIEVSWRAEGGLILLGN